MELRAKVRDGGKGKGQLWDSGTPLGSWVDVVPVSSASGEDRGKGLA